MNWTEEIDQTTAAFQVQFNALTFEQLNWKPDSKTWSIAQNLDHLIRINESYFPIFELLKTGTYKTPLLSKIGFLVTFFGKFILKSVNPNRRKKMKTFRIWEPSQSEVPNILERFQAHQSQLKAQINSLQHWVDQGSVIHSPASATIVYKLEAAFDIIVSHEKRHLEQAKEVLDRHLKKI